ncbi:unnamed protein product [Nippostrongylus brasiliensis]|uniref:Protein DEK (inferred by orthology to a human protein) n=1 Tax=Nippostrongylus brasiliensis TaxID=27835 RepID=A0A158QXE3_NIPBR|nr:unnamed protein product [Nippostrongylus brasiliensis]
MECDEGAKIQSAPEEVKSESMETEAEQGDIAEKAADQSGEKKEENNEEAKEATPKKETPRKESPKKETPKESLKKETPKKEEEGDAEDEEDAESDGEADDEQGEAKKGLFDMPLEVEGKRERHKVERITISTSPTKKSAHAVPMGNGVPLGSMHKVLYGTTGKSTTMKREIRKFTGFGFAENSPEFNKKVALLSKLTVDQLKFIRNVLGLHFSGGSGKEAMASSQRTFKDLEKNFIRTVTTIMVFLMKTVDHERAVRGAKKRKSTAQTPKAKRVRKSKGDDEIKSDSDDDENDEDDDDEEEEEEKQKEKKKEKEKPAAKTPKKAAAEKEKPAAKTPKKRQSNAKEAKVDTDSDASAEVKKKRRTTKTPKKVAKAPSSSDSDTKKKSKNTSKKDSDDDTSSSTSQEPPIEEEKPTEKELVTVIEELLSEVDLSQVSMKQMCQAVIEKFPGTNLGSRVDFLKGKIKHCLATK